MRISPSEKNQCDNTAIDIIVYHLREWNEEKIVVVDFYILHQYSFLSEYRLSEVFISKMLFWYYWEIEMDMDFTSSMLVIVFVVNWRNTRWMSEKKLFTWFRLWIFGKFLLNVKFLFSIFCALALIGSYFFLIYVSRIPNRYIQHMQQR